MKQLSNSTVKKILNAFLRCDTAQAVRHTASREVFRFVFKENEVYYLKLFYLPRNFLVRFCTYSKRFMECFHYKRMLKRGAPLPPLVGCDRIRYHDRDAIAIVTKEMPHSIVLSEYITQYGLNQNTGVLQSLALFLAKSYQEGFFHNDLHPGNIIWIENSDDFLFVDVTKIMFRRYCSSMRVIKNILTLFPSFYSNAAFSDRVWRNFRSQVLQSAGVQEVRAALVEYYQKRVFLQWLRRRTKRCIHSNRDFEVYKDCGVTGVYVKRFQPVWENTEPISILDRLFKKSVTFYKDSNTTAVGNFQLNNESIVIKKFKVKRWFNPLKNILRSSRGRRTWILGWHLILQKLPVPEPAFYFERRSGRLLYENYLGMAYYSNAVPADEFLLTENQFDRRKFIAECAGICRKIAASTVYHADFQLKNILVRNENDTIAFCVIDLDSIIMSHLSESKKIKCMIGHLKKSYLRLDKPDLFTVSELMRFCVLVFKNTSDRQKSIRRFLK